MRNFLITVFTICIVCSFTINAQTLDPVAVIDFSGEGISAMTLTATSEIFRSELINTGLFKVMDREQNCQMAFTINF